MNSVPEATVEPVTMRYWLPAASLFLAMLAGCVDVNGGAVELSWSVRTSEGEPLGCAAELGLDKATIQLQCRTLEGGLCDIPRRLPDWPCDHFGGSTRFEIPEGTYQFSIRVKCLGATPAEGIRVPDPIVRQIIEGEVAQLNALLIEVSVPDGGCQN